MSRPEASIQNRHRDPPPGMRIVAAPIRGGFIITTVLPPFRRGRSARRRISGSGFCAPQAAFSQQEYVAGFFADLNGHFLYVDRPRVCVWTGIATYRLLGGLLKLRIPEGGTVTLTKVEGGWELSHDVFMDYSDSLFGKAAHWMFTHWFDGQKAVFEHANREVVYFKTELERQRSPALEAKVIETATTPRA